ncbi:uncharacterized protein LTR77_010752 [Saxophila tyrrhenica]|uniref:Uncharacterized protein n=1 Tax=Saxophila tyrrhenica TaxID=1690608 RepID=A0AAV9NX51_9PEZI|nr:hypothetical protein LTR77_010752 [Saxophila tyrrhenica]
MAATTANQTTANVTTDNNATGPAQAAETAAASQPSDDDSDVSMDDSDMSDRSDFTDDLWVPPESSYLSGEILRASPTGVIYDLCTAAELKKFVNDRRLQDPYPQGVTLKYFYLRELEKADESLSFRFMDLPAEMRLLTYRQLLVHHNNGQGPVGHLHPQILRTCKMVHAEAKEVLYDDNTFCAFFSVCQGGDVTHRLARVHGESMVGHCGHMKYYRIPRAIEDYPELFRRIARLKITLDYECYDESENGDEYDPALLNYPLWGLASFLMDGHRLKRLHLELILPDGLTDQDYETTLFPLRRLSNIKTLTVTDNVPSRIVQKLKSDLRSSEPAFNSLRHWKLLDDEANAQMELFTSVHPGYEEDYGEDFLSASMEDLSFQSTVPYMWKQKCFNSRLEERFIAQLSMLREALQGLQAVEIKKLIEAVLEKRAALKAYNEVSDDGRLAEAMSCAKDSNLFGKAVLNEEGDEWSDDEEPDEEPTVEKPAVSGPSDKPPSTAEEGDPQGTNKPGAEVTPHPTLTSSQIDAIFDEWVPPRSPSPEL